MNVSLPVCSAINRYIKITIFFEDSKSAQISASVFNLVSYPVYDVGGLIAAQASRLNIGTGVSVKVRVIPAHRFGSQGLAHPAANFKHTLSGLCVDCSTF